MSDREWLLRPYDASTDEDGLMYLLGMNYCRSSAAKRAGVQATNEPTAPDAAARQRVFLNDCRPVWRWLLESAETLVAVDAESPETSIWGWMITSGPEVLHAIGCKRSIIEAGLCQELVLDMLGERWTTPQVMTLELPQMREGRPGWPPKKEWFNFARPAQWVLDPCWLARHMAREAA